MKYPVLTYGDIKFDALYLPGTPTKTVRLTRRQDGYEYDTKIQDINPLNSIYKDDFFKLPFVQHTITVSEEHRADLISWNLYSETDYWSYIMLFNRLVDPMADLTAGKVINIPVFANLISWLTKNLIQNPING